MANSLTTNPIVLTQAMTSGYKAGVAASLGSPLGPVRVEKIYWENPGTVGDTIILVDPQTGRTLIALRCEVAGQSQLVDWTAAPVLWRDFQAQTVGSSTVYIYTR
jgi:hypothetical protein